VPAQTMSNTAIEKEARNWFEQNWDPKLSLGAWWERLAASGWGFPTWPAESHGRGLPPEAMRIVADVRRSVGALGPPAGIAQNLAGPTIWTHGTEEQKKRFLPNIVTGKEIWCQLFSEPGAGSDLAGLRTKAERDGDEWVVNGQKIWTSGAQFAKYGILIARTNSEVRKHRGLSYFVIEIDQPGIEIRPITEMTGRAIFNEVFFTDARVPHANLLGEQNGGWGVTLTTLAHERTMLGAGSMGGGGMVGLSIGENDLNAIVGDLVPHMEGSSRTDSKFGGPNGEMLVDLARKYDKIDDPLTRQDIARVYTLLEIGRYTVLRSKASQSRSGRPGPEVSTGKLAANAMIRELRESVLRILGPAGVLAGKDGELGGRIENMVLSSPLFPIGGGTDQIQRNIIGERVLGLPSEPRPDKELPFKDIPAGVSLWGKKE